MDSVTDEANIVHGVTAYAKGKCRCEDCRLAWRTYMRGHRGGKRKGRPGVFKGAPHGIKVTLTTLGADIARAAAIRNKRTVDDVVEAALRSCASRLQFGSVSGTH